MSDEQRTEKAGTASPHEISARRRMSAMQLWRSGVSIAEIARRLEVTRQQALKLVRREVEVVIQENDPDLVRTLHSEALMDVWYALYRPAAEGDIEAIDRFLRVEERIARLLGLDLGEGSGERLPEPAPARAEPHSNGAAKQSAALAD